MQATTRFEDIYGGYVTAEDQVAEARERGMTLEEMAAELTAAYPQFGRTEPAPENLYELTLAWLEEAAG